MSAPIPVGVDRREVIWPNEKLVLTSEDGSATSVPQVGTVTITPAATQVVVHSVTPELTLSTRTDSVTLDAEGTMHAYLVCTDDPDIEPHNSWTYKFSGSWPGAPIVTCPVPMVEVDPETGKMPPLNLSTVVSRASVSGVLITKGATGDPGPTIESVDPDGTVHLTDGTTVTWALPPAVADDAAVALLVAAGTETKAAVEDRVLSVVEGSYAPILAPDTGSLAMSKVRLGLPVNAGIAGDSTGNAANEWFDLLATAVGAAHPSMAVEIPHWNDATQALDAPTVIQPGTVGGSGVVFHDTFNRTAADLYGSTPDIGAVWGRDGSNASGDWTLDGTDAVRSSDATVGTLVGTASPGEMRTELLANIGTLATGTQRIFRLYSQMKDTSNSVFLTFSVSTTGAPSATITKRIAAVNTVIGTAASIPSVGTNTASNEIAFELSLSGTMVTAKVNGTTFTGPLTTDDLAALAGATNVGVAGSSAGGAGDRLHEITVTVGSPAPAPVARFYNASMSGSTLTYQQARLAAMFPQPLDLLFVSSCHNYSTDTPAQYAAKLDAFVAAFRAVQPTAGIVIVSQNPQKPPATNPAAHKARLASLRSYATRRGFGYIPVAETWAKQPSGGVGLILPDGIHPTTGAGSGSALWADTAAAYLDSV